MAKQKQQTKTELVPPLARKPANFNTVYCDLDDLYYDIRSNRIDANIAGKLIAATGKRIRQFDQKIAAGRLNPMMRQELLTMFGPIGAPTPDGLKKLENRQIQPDAAA